MKNLPAFDGARCEIAKCHTLCHNHLRRKFFILSLALISENKGSSGKREIQQQSLSLKEAHKANGLVSVCARHNLPTQLRGDSNTFFLILFGSQRKSGVFFYSSVGNWLDARGVRAAYLGSGAGAGWIRTRRQADRQLRGGERLNAKGKSGHKSCKASSPPPKNRTRTLF